MYYTYAAHTLPLQLVPLSVYFLTIFDRFAEATTLRRFNLISMGAFKEIMALVNFIYRPSGLYGYVEFNEDHESKETNR